VPDDPTRFDFFGESYRFNPAEDYQWELLEFTDAAPSGADSELLSGAASVMRLIKAAVHADDWERFRASARKNKALVRDHLMPVVLAAYAQPIDRPTGLPSGSSDGQPATAPNSADDSSSRVIARLEQQGRPDLALVVAQSQGLVA
jgi:hypothetical protein